MAQPVTTIGELVVIALKAENLPNRVATGRQDPFCIFKLGSTAKKTKIDQNGGKNPIWDDQINLPVPQGVTRLFVQVFNRQAAKENLISEGHVDLNEVLRKGEHDGFFPLVMNGTKAGQIYLELTFYAGPVHRQPQQHMQQQRPPPIRHYGNRPPPPPQASSSYTPMSRPAPPMPQPRPYPAPPMHVRPPPMMNHAQRHTSVRPLPLTPPQQQYHHHSQQHVPPSTTQPVRYSSVPANTPTVAYHHPPSQTPLPANGYPPRPVYPPQQQQQSYPTPPHGFNGPPSHHPRPYGAPPPQQQPFPPSQQSHPPRPYPRPSGFAPF